MNSSGDSSLCEKHIWSQLLQEVKEKSAKIRETPNSLLVLGNELSGKSSLIARLQKSDPKNGVGLEFEFIDVKDDLLDENKQLNVWIAPGDALQSNLLKYALDENNFGFTICMITVNFAEPWTIMDSLQMWLDILRKHINRLKLNPTDLSVYKETLFRHFQEYSDPEVDKNIHIALGKRRDTTFNFLHPGTAFDLDTIAVGLREDVVDRNMGIPIVVVMTKTDHMPTFEKEYQYNEDKFDFIQMNVRKLCLKYGAALCYTSVKDDYNCDTLFRYLLHRCYGFPFLDPANVIDKDAIFIPAGWDSVNKINILADSLPEDIRNRDFDGFITKPLSLVKAMAQTRLAEPQMAEDEQVFLMRQHTILQRLKTTFNSTTKEDPPRVPISRPPLSTSHGPGRGRKPVSGQTVPMIRNTQANEGVLTNFFSSLLNKRTGAGANHINHQDSTVSDPGKGTGNSSEAEDSVKEDVKAIESSSDIDDNRKTKSSEIIG